MLRSTTPTIDIYVKLAQYPVLSDQIRLRMREELFKRGIVSKADFEAEVEQLALESQRREGLDMPTVQEDEATWRRRKERIRDFHTDAYFAHNLGSSLLEQIVDDLRSGNDKDGELQELTFNPEIAPWQLLFRQGELYESLPAPDREKIHHHLQEVKVVLIKRLISDLLPFIGIAKNVFEISDLQKIYNRLLGSGMIGGKAGGMMLAWKILQKKNPTLGPDLSRYFEIPQTYFLGSEVVYEFVLVNQLDDFVDQKYLPPEKMEEQYPKIVSSYLKGEFPPHIVEQLREMLEQMNGAPFIVRSSSLLEDNLTNRFSQKYHSFICANQGSASENLTELLNAIRHVFASTSNPEAVMFRREQGLLDYDERMGVIFQKLSGYQYGRYFFPAVTGIGFSRNLTPWHDQIRPEDGAIRLLLGFGRRMENPLDPQDGCLIALSHPNLRADELDDPNSWVPAQQKAVVIDLLANCVVKRPVSSFLYPDYPFMPYLTGNRPDQLSFRPLTADPKFVKIMRMMLMRLERVYAAPVEVEFTVDVSPNTNDPKYKVYILRCRPIGLS